MANLRGFTAAEVGFLVVKPFKKHPILARVTNDGAKRDCFRVGPGIFQVARQ